jgi:hypothetical protein
MNGKTTEIMITTDMVYGCLWMFIVEIMIIILGHSRP